MRKGVFESGKILSLGLSGGIPKFTLTNGDENSKSLLARMEVKNTVVKDSSETLKCN